ncbi:MULTISPECIES: glycosyltransferase [Raoultella]|uniref:glycosyltransferase n=1 Tax=Raoultella TaxID=160674 RepID=UPI00065E8D5A|nr:glycosyltransferase [Raoultella planticola]HDT6557953.1 glycosyltransferase [Raoultella ornithinolytica]
MERLNNIAAVVVAYNAEEAIVNNIESYIDYVDKLYFVNNGNSRDLFDKISSSYGEKVILIDEDENLGISKAINLAAKDAFNIRCQYLLTMDQDSYFDDFSTFIKLFDKHCNETIAIYTPAHITGDRKYPTDSFTYIKSVMTSGNILNLDVFFKLDGMDERLFIDRVDHDYCLSVIENGYSIIRFNNCKLFHGLGNSSIINGVEVTNHSPLRRYYMTRNTLIIMFKHFRKQRLNMVKLLYGYFNELYHVFRYEKNRMDKMFFVMKGVWHFFSRKNGRYSG